MIQKYQKAGKLVGRYSDKNGEEGLLAELPLVTITGNKNHYLAKRLNLRNQSSSEMPLRAVISNGTLQYTRQPNPGAGYLSGSDPVGEFVVGNAVLNKPLQWGGKAVMRAARSIANRARAAKVSRVLNTSIDNFDGTVGNEYFRAPDKWYRITETPEVQGIKEIGMNATTTDMGESGISVAADRWRRSVLDNNLAPVVDLGWKVQPKRRFATVKYGLAHGNTSLAAKGLVWGETVSASYRFPEVVLEGNFKNKLYRGMDPTTGADSRTSFIMLDWESIPTGSRLGFHTGEMPLEGLKAFLKLPNGRFRFEPVLPNKTVSFVLPTNTSSTKTGAF